MSYNDRHISTANVFCAPTISNSNKVLSFLILSYTILSYFILSYISYTEFFYNFNIHIHIHIIIFFQVAVLTCTAFCSEACCDHQHVYDGTSSVGGHLGTHSGCSVPAVRWSSSRYMYVNWISDLSVVNSGFSCTFTSGKNYVCI